MDEKYNNVSATVCEDLTDLSLMFQVNRHNSYFSPSCLILHGRHVKIEQGGNYLVYLQTNLERMCVFFPTFVLYLRYVN